MSGVNDPPETKPDLESQAEQLRRTQLELEAARSRYFDLYDLAPVGYCTLSDKGMILEANLTAVGLFGATRKVLYQQPITRFIHAVDQDLYHLTFRKVLTSGAPQSCSLRMLNEDGSLFWADLNATVTQELDGTTLVRTVISDISARKGAENALLESHQFNDQIIRCAQEGIVVYDLDLRYQVWNPYMEQMSGLPARDVLGRHPLELFPFLNDTGLIERLQLALEGVSFDPVEFPFQLTQTGKSGWSVDASGPLYNAKHEIIGVIGLVRDITERKQAEERQRLLELRLQQAQKLESLGQLAGGVAHDMNNVLGAILGLSSTHLEMQAQGSPVYQAFETITKAATRGGDMVNSLLGFARQSPSDLAEVDLNALLAEEARLLKCTTPDKVRTALELAPNLDRILGYANSLSRAFTHLCVNALDAMGEQGALTLRTHNIGQDWVEVEIIDTGCGMSTEVLKKALDPFFTTKGVGKGTGLGLSIVYGIVKAHHGHLEIKSEPGKGTTIQMRFPVCPTRVPPPAAPMAHPTTAIRGALKVLMVDDEDLIHSTMSLLLEALGHTCIAVRSGEEALAKVKDGETPDVVILDVNMPGLGGAGTLPLLRDLLPTVPILLATGRADQGAMDLLAMHPGVTLLAKPFSIGELREALEALFQG